ncbi:ATP-binding protein [Frigoribacterium sp. CFBP 8754]|uniref:ATP-binding protein n=1 Tax=Frigoribacterium sp. CFBP 8754 TaxID=2775290 RepID=UPI00177FC615|nr:ATP-binding protein [Frigoribacterium sp. CFBP 8754]MBD8660750.1 ATP-binding protein [Frigoribacterium sp. CFBP 8754]
MSLSLPDVDFARIRPYGQPAARSNAFEELASILIQQGVAHWPAGTSFHRFGNPDGGREGKGVLPNGDVWAWQAKYLFTFDSSAAGQIDGSVRRVLELEPNLKKYFVALPIDLPAGDTATRVSANTRWDQKVAEWQELANAKGLSVSFVFVGAHQLLTALTEPRHAGRARYWFDAPVLTKVAQEHLICEVLAKAGRRYSPRLHVAVSTTKALDGVGRVDSYTERWQNILADLRSTRRWPWRAPEADKEAYDDALALCDAALVSADESLQQMISATRSFDELPDLSGALRTSLERLNTVSGLLRERAQSESGFYLDAAGTLYTDVRDATVALGRGQQLVDSVATQAAQTNEMLLVGGAGVGKTHLLCDVARKRVAAGRPTVMILGQDFDGRSLFAQVGELSGLGGSVDEVLAVLDAAAEASGARGLLIIDAVNESEKPERWLDTARALRTKVARFPHVALVLSCRNEFLGSVIEADDLPLVEHFGFDEAVEDAVQRFATEYGLEAPSFPVLNVEFSNPLFLKLTCEALTTLGSSRFTFGAAGLTTLCNAFTEAVNLRLSSPSRCDFDVRSNLVGQVVHELARLGNRTMTRLEVEKVTSALLPQRTWSKSLMSGLLAEGLLIEVGDKKIAFGYQRLGDVALAAEIAGKTPGDIRAWVLGLGRSTWREHGVISALAVMVPEIHKLELVDLVAVDGSVPAYAVDSFLESLVLREPSSIDKRTIEVVEGLLISDLYSNEMWDRLVRLACIPDHPLNAAWLHQHLAALTMPDRDATWSTWLVGALDVEESSPVKNTIRWAWPGGDRGSEHISEEVAPLATQLLAWFLTTTDRRVRDQATKAMVSVGERRPRALVDVLTRLNETDDPYVIERVTGAACGVALRQRQTEVVFPIAEALQEYVEPGWPMHLLTRDYIRRVMQVAREMGWDGPDGSPPYGAAWPVTSISADEIEALAGPPEYSYGSIWHSLSGMGDFGRKVLKPALGRFQCDDRGALQDAAERAIFDRTLDLGWSPEKFGLIDDRRRAPMDGPVERVGKKYQWIGMYEVLGAISDHTELKEEWSSDGPRAYASAEDVIWRDIDVTILARQPGANDAPSDWFSPLKPTFPTTLVTDYPVDMSGIPDPIDLLGPTDPDGNQWIALLSFPSWRQEHDPEVLAVNPPTRDAWMQLHAYLVPTDELETLKSWAMGRDWFGRWMPDIAEPANLLLGGHPSDTHWATASGQINADEWNTYSGGPQPVELMQCGAAYGGTGSNRDASDARETQGFLPTRALFDMLGLRHGIDFLWNDDEGLAVFDPSVSGGGEGVLLLRRDLVATLERGGYSLFWTVLAGHEHSTGGFGVGREDYRWISASAAYVLEGNSIKKVYSRAARFRPGPEKEYEFNWELRPEE